MRTRIRRGLTAATLVAGVMLAAAPAAGAAAAPADALSGIATDLRYGQPDLNGTRNGSNTITLTNTGTTTIEFPKLTFPRNDRDVLLHDVNCRYLSGNSTQTTCITEPLAAGASYELALPWQSNAARPSGTGEARLEQASDSSGTPVAGTASTVTWKVSSEAVTGTFSIKATPLTYGERDRYGIRHGSTKVTVTNLSTETQQFPLVTFPASSGDPSFMAWKDCVQTIKHIDDIVCVEAPLAPGEKRTAKFWFHSAGTVFDFTASVRVDAGSDEYGTVVPGTAAGTTYAVNSPDDN
ncbi:hypothetical protein OHA21_41775 [Actinoplanes sp. NBC_00393]|uniref:hypothetical protein n=1 Tax=Actinoplanes sp. NBC_00393 TaxID=2975953 RepID=UPI002E2323D4